MTLPKFLEECKWKSLKEWRECSQGIATVPLIHVLLRVRDACFTKCIHRFAEAEISPGEGTCIDRYETTVAVTDFRCVIKYMKVYEKVGQRIAPDLQQPQ